MELMVGRTAPNFSLEGTDGKFNLSDMKGNWVILFFFPKARTSVCQSEVAGFNKHFSEFSGLGAKLVGISIDDLQTLKDWKQDLGDLNYPLLSDPNGEVARAYGVYSESEGIAYRGLFIIDPEGRIRYQVVQEPLYGRSTKEVRRMLTAL